MLWLFDRCQMKKATNINNPNTTRLDSKYRCLTHRAQSSVAQINGPTSTTWVTKKSPRVMIDTSAPRRHERHKDSEPRSNAYPPQWRRTPGFVLKRLWRTQERQTGSPNVAHEEKSVRGPVRALPNAMTTKTIASSCGCVVRNCASNEKSPSTGLLK